MRISMYRSFNPRPVPLDKARVIQMVDDLFEKWETKIKKIRSIYKPVGRRANVSLNFEMETVKGIFTKGQVQMAGVSKNTAGYRIYRNSSLFGLGALYIGTNQNSRTHLGVKFPPHPDREWVLLPFNNKWDVHDILEWLKDSDNVRETKVRLFELMLHELTHWKDLFNYKERVEWLVDLWKFKGGRYKITKLRDQGQWTNFVDKKGKKILINIPSKGGWQQILDNFGAKKVKELKDYYKRKGWKFTDKHIAEKLHYYNSSWEVRAYMQEIVHQVNAFMQRFKEEAAKKQGKYKVLSVGYRFMYDILRGDLPKEMSQTWDWRNAYWSQKNKAYILDAVVQNLQESDLMPDSRKGKKPFKEKPTPTRAYRKPTKRPPILPLDQCMGLKMVANPAFKIGDRVQEGNRKGVVKSLRSKGTVDVLFDDMDYVIRRQLGNVKRINPRRKNKGKESQLENIWYDWIMKAKKPSLRKGYLSVEELEPFREYNRSQLRNSPRTKYYQKLKEKINQNGIKEPITLILGANGHAYIGEGNHRHEIAKELGITHLPVELIFWQSPSSKGGTNWSQWYREDASVDKNDLITEILADLNLNPQNILIPPPPSEKKRIAELKKIKKQYKDRFVPHYLQKQLDEKVGDTFNDLLKSEGYRNQRAQIKKWNNGIIKQVMLHKNFFNAERPKQLAKRKGIPFKYDDLKTTKTPSYPSGHTTQAYFLALKLSQKYPEMTSRFFNLANMVAQSRIDRGVHFPSDNEAGMMLAQQVFDLGLVK